MTTHLLYLILQSRAPWRCAMMRHVGWHQSMAVMLNETNRLAVHLVAANVLGGRFNTSKIICHDIAVSAQLLLALLQLCNLNSTIGFVTYIIMTVSWVIGHAGAVIKLLPRAGGGACGGACEGRGCWSVGPWPYICMALWPWPWRWPLPPPWNTRFQISRGPAPGPGWELGAGPGLE